VPPRALLVTNSLGCVDWNMIPLAFSHANMRLRTVVNAIACLLPCFTTVTLTVDLFVVQRFLTRAGRLRLRVTCRVSFAFTVCAYRCRS